MKRVIILVLDSLGVGQSADACRYADVGADTLGHIGDYCIRHQEKHRRDQSPLSLPNLSQLGLFAAHKASTGHFVKQTVQPDQISGAWGYAKELSLGKDTPSGHWEMAGVPVLFDWGYFTETHKSFPPTFLQELMEQAQIPGFLGDCHASGTEIIQQYGQQHCQSLQPIIYTSTDSVCQIAAHEQVFSLERLTQVCRIARRLLDPYHIARVIARPFTGRFPNFIRTGNRRDYTVLPPAPTVLDKLYQQGHPIIGIGKIADIYAHQGISSVVKATGIDALMNATIKALHTTEQGVIMTNFVDFDSEYGHRRDPLGYALALEAFDKRLSELMRQMRQEDWLIITADHGCDPTWPGTNHTREHVPVLVYGHKVQPTCLGFRQTFADIGQSVAEYLHVSAMDYGTSFCNQLSKPYST